MPPHDSAQRFHYLMMGLITVMQIGGIIDARMHVFHGFNIDSFFVPAHYVLYGGWFGVLGAVALYWAWRRKAGAKPGDRLPQGYDYAAWGAALFGCAGALDAVWHTLFGFELNLQVLLSPSHLVLFFAIGLIYFSVVRHAAHRYDLAPGAHQRSLVTSLPLNVGIASLFVIVFWPTWYFDPMAADYASSGAIVGTRGAYSFIDYGSRTAEIAGVGGLILTTLIVVPFVILPLQRWRLPAGSLVFILAWVFLQRAIILGVYRYLPAVLGAAIVGEIIWAWMRRGGEARLASPRGYRALAFAVPFALFAFYFLSAALTPNGIVWPVHLWAGSIGMAGMAGLLLSYALIQPPRGAAAQRAT